MKDEKDGAAGTSEASPTDAANFQTRFNEALEGWRAEGCRTQIEDPQRADQKMDCGGKPHRTKILPKDADGNVTMSVDCEHGHEGVWSFKIPEADMKAELNRQAVAAAIAEANGGKAMDPMKASLKITMDLKTQQVTIDPWVPTPGIGIQLAGILMSHFFAEMQKNVNQQVGGLKLPPKGILNPKTGKPFVS